MERSLVLTFLFVVVILFAGESANGGIKACCGGTPFLQNETVTLPVSVINQEGGIIGGLKTENFKIAAGNEPVQIISVVEKKGPASIGFLIDVSRSMGAKYINDARNAILTIVENGGANNEYFLTAFHTDIDKLSSFTDGKSVSKMVSSDPYFSSDQPGGSTLYDAVASGLAVFSTAKHERQYLIVFGDARDRSSTTTSEQLRGLVGKNSTVIHFFGRSAGEPEGGYSEFSKIARASGGFSANPFNDSHETGFSGQNVASRYISYRGKTRLFPDYWSAFFTDFSNQLANSYLITFKPPEASKKGEPVKTVVSVELPPELKKMHRGAIVRSKDLQLAIGK